MPVDVPPVPVLFLVADTGGGHRAAALAVAQALHRDYPRRFDPVLHDPLGGPAASGPLRRGAGWYGPVIRFAPWLWGAAFHASNSAAAMRLLNATLLAGACRTVRAAVARQRPAVIVSFHPLAGAAAVAAGQGVIPVVTVVTDLGRPHAAWRSPAAGHIVRALPVAGAFGAGPLDAAGRAGLRRRLGVPAERFLVVLTGGGEGSGGLAARARALLRHCRDVQVVVICGRNTRLRERLRAVAADSAGRLVVHGFVTTMADWLRCADLVVGKAGPGTIAEASCCGTPLLLTSRLPGQEAGNPGIVLRAGAGRYVPRVADLVREVRALHRNPAALAALRRSAVRLGRPDAAREIAALLAGLTQQHQPAVTV